MDLSFENFLTLGMLILLQAVLGFDNLLYISLESKRAPQEKRQYVRTMGILIAIALRIGLLFLLIHLIDYFQDPFLTFNIVGISTGVVNVHSLIVLGGGVFIMYTAVKEIWHMISVDNLVKENEELGTASVGKVIAWIIVMNLIFSFDSILSAMALTNVFWVMASAIVISGVLMLWLSDKVAVFLEKNRMYEVLGLFILFIVGIMLITEGGHLAHFTFMGHHLTPMSKPTFYFVIVTLVLIDIVQGRYQKKLGRK